MRKNINKLVAVAIGVSIISGSIVPVFAADTTTQNTSATTNAQANANPVLTLKDAIESAISNSATLALYATKINYQNKINDVNEMIEDASDISGDLEDFNEDTRDLTLNQLKQKRDFDQDNLVQKTTKAYNDIVTSQMKIDKAERELKIKNKELNDTKLKKDLGMLTSIDLQTTELQIESLQNAQKSSENALKDAQESFKVLTGKDVTKYSLEKDINYESFEIDSSVDEYLDDVIDKFVKYSEESVKLNKDYYKDENNYISSGSGGKLQIKDVTTDEIKTYKDAADPSNKPVEPIDKTDLTAYQDYLNKRDKYEQDVSAYSGALAGRLGYLTIKLGTYEGETNLNEAKKAYKESLRSLYTNLLTKENNIKTLKKNIELNNKQLSNEKLKYDLGLMTKSDYDNQVVSSEDLELQLRSAIDGYNTLKEEIQKPWIALS